MLVDTPPLGYASESTAFTANVDGGILVLDCQHTRKRSLRQASYRLQSAGANVLGTIMNNSEVPRDRATEDAYYSIVPTEY